MLETTENSLKDFLSELTYEQIQLDFSSGTFYKGLKYYEQGRVSDLTIQGADKLTARVHGSLRYVISIKLLDHKLHEHCSCPIGGGCKHVVAVLLYCVDHAEEINEQEHIPDSPDMKKVEQYLQSLSKKELIRLVLKFAPGNFKELITFNSLGKDQSKRLFDKVVSQIESLPQDDELLYDPVSFESALVALLEKLKGVWEKFPEETGELIIRTLKQLNALMDEGYLYDDYYDGVFEGDDLSRVIRDYIYSLPFDKKMDFIEQVEGAISEMDYDFCEGILMEREKLFSEKETPEVKAYFLKEVGEENYENAEAYFKLLSDHLTPHEKERVLKAAHHVSEYLTLELARLYKSNGSKDEAIRVIEVYLQASAEYYRNTKELYVELLQLKNEMGYPLDSTAREALNKHSSISLLEMIVEYLPANQIAFENIVKKKDAYKYLEYLEKHQRFREAVQFMGESDELWDDVKYRFFIKNFEQCPEEAETYFVKRIEQELPHTGDRHYYAIADSLKALKKIDRNKAIFIAQDIRNEYKRRRNLMEAIKGI